MDTIADTTGHDAFGFVHVEFEGTLDVADTALNFNSLDIDGNYLYAVGDSIFATISILDPLAPVCSSEYVIPGVNNLILEDVEVRGNFAFLVGGIITPGGGSDGILIVLNIGKPKEPTYVSSFIKRGTPTENHYFTAIDLEGNVAYVVDSFSNFYSIDITNYTTMSEIGNVAIDPGGHDLMVDGNWAYIACSHSIVSVNVTTPGTLVVGDADTIDYVGDLYVDGDWLYVVCGDGSGYGLWKYDITDPTSITYYSSDYWYDCAIPYGVSIMGDWGYIMGYKLDNSTHPDTFSTIGVFDVTDNVKFVCSFNFMRELMRRLHKNGETMLYTVGRYFDGSSFVGAARAIRVGYPDSCVFEPGEIVYYSIPYGHYLSDIPTEPSQIEVRGDYAFVVDSVGMTVIDIKDPSSMVIVGDFLDTLHIFYGINVSGNSAFLTSTGPDTSFWIVDIKDPSPRPPWPLPLIGSTISGTHDNIAGEVKIEGNVAYTFTLDNNTIGNLVGFLDAFKIRNLTTPIWLSSDNMYSCTDTCFIFYDPYFGELQIEGDTTYVSWRYPPYNIPFGGGAGIMYTNHIPFFDITNPARVSAFVPVQQIVGGGTVKRNMGFFRENPSPNDCGGAIYAEGNIMYSTIGRPDRGLEPVGSPTSNNYGLFRYSIDTTYGGYVLKRIVGGITVYYSPWINSYKSLTNNGFPLELTVDGDFAFCSFDRDSLYFIKVDSVEGYDPKYDAIPIYNHSFNDFKANGDYLYAVAESLSASWYKGMFFAIRVYRRNHCVPSGTYKRAASLTKNLPYKLNINCYPNPFNRSLNISVVTDYPFEIHIYNANGKLIWSYKNEKYKDKKTITWTPTKNTPSGIYFVEYISRGFSTRKKVLLIK